MLATMGRILTFYFIGEIFGTFAISLLILVSIIVIQHMIRITEWIVKHGVSVVDMMMLLVLNLPFFLTLLIPMALLLSVLLAMNRMSADGEITALRAAGVGAHRFLIPVLMLAVLAGAATGYFGLNLGPKSERLTKEILTKIATTKAQAIISPHTFQNYVPGLTIYVEEVENEVLKGVMLAETSNSRKFAQSDADFSIITAREGRILSTSDNDASAEATANMLVLENGTVHLTDTAFSIYRKVTFKRLELKLLKAGDAMLSDVRLGGPDAMSIDALEGLRQELVGKIEAATGSNDPEVMESDDHETKKMKRKLIRVEMAMHQKWSLPIACIVLALWGVPLGIQPPRSSRYRGVVMSIVLIVAYYALISAAKLAAMTGLISALYAMWAPNAVVLLTGLFFLSRVARDKPLPLSNAAAAMSDTLGNIWERLSGKL